MARRRGEMQERVLDVLRRHGGQRSAYAILAELREENAKIAPPTIYRALTALVERGAVHRLESLNTFVACQRDDHPHASILSICDDCGTVEECLAPDLLSDIATFAGRTGFQASRQVVEVHGVCAACGGAEVPK